MTSRMCSCGRPGIKRGMCSTHYQQWRAATPPEERQRPTAVERFNSKFERRGPDECWPWKPPTNSQGYGVFLVERRKVGAHRVAFLLANGTLPEVVDHTCHNNSGCRGGTTCEHRRCVNPAHLENTTNRENCLRGEGVSARHARATHCVNGHEFSAENTYHPPATPQRRMCRTCTRDRQRVVATERKIA